MTAPNTAPVQPNGGAGDSRKIFDLEDAAFAAELGLEKTHPTAPEPTAPRDTDGKFVAKDTVLADTTLAKDTPAAEATTEDAPADADTPAEAVAAEDNKEEAVVDPDKPADPVKPPLTKFQAFDKDGEIEVPSDLVFNYKVDGKVVEKVPLEKVIHLAQQATYNARQVQDLSERNTAGDQQLQQTLQTIKEYEQSLAQMFQGQDDSLYLRAKALHLQNNSPERIAEAARAEAAQVRQQYTTQQEQVQVAQFVMGTIEPALVELEKEYPSVTRDDLAGRVALGLKAFEVNGRVPLANLPKVAHYVNTDVADWAAAAHAKRTEASRTASTTLAKERAVVQSKQRQMGKALAPVSTTAASPTKPAPITRARDVLNDPIFGGPQ